MDALRIEIDRNYDSFQRSLGKLLRDHRGQYALMKSARIVEYFETPGEAYRQGLARYPDRIFSIQQVSEQPTELGMMSVAVR